MKKQVGLVTIETLSNLFARWAAGVAVLCCIMNTAVAQEFSFADRAVRRSFEKRLEQYVNQKSQQFVTEITQNERALSEFEENVKRELRSRGTTGIEIPALNRQERESEPDLGLLKEFNTEISQLLDLAREIAILEKRADERNDAEAYQKLAEMQAQVFALLEAENLTESESRALSNSPLSERELSRRNSTLAIRIRLSKLAESAQSSSDRDLLKKISERINSLSKAVHDADSQDQAIANSYISEVSLLLDILEEIEALKNNADERDLDLAGELKELRGTIVASLKTTLVSIMAFRSALATGPTVSEIYSEWQAVEYAKFQLRFTRYQIRKNWLLRHASGAGQRQMLERDLYSSFANVISKRYEVAKKQFDWILKEYGSQFDDYATVLFYRADCLYELKLYELAARDYAKIVSSTSQTEYFAESVYRLLLISERRGDDSEFAKYFRILNSQTSQVSQEITDKCRYLAAYKYTREGNYSQARETLSLIQSESEYSSRASFLLGMVYVNEENFASAIELFKTLVGSEAEGSADPSLRGVRNDALLKLGFLYYQQGEYDEARKYFDRVTAHHADFDQSILGSAWASFKTGDLDKAREQVSVLLQEELLSPYTYEALVLSAHCKRLQDQDEAALADLRYVANARRVSELSLQYNRERKQIFEQLARLERLEANVLEQRDYRLYEMTSEIREQIESVLASFPYHGNTGTIVLEEFQNERQAIVSQIGDLDDIVSKTFTEGDVENMEKANRQRERLLKSLDTYTADKEVKNVNAFLDYPLATKEGNEKFRRTLLRDLKAEIQDEKKRIAQSYDQAAALQSDYRRNGSNDLTTKIDLELLQQELTALENRSSQLAGELSETDIADLDTDFDRLAEFSGFGMSDQTYDSYKTKEAEIAQLAYNFSAITKMLETRKQELQRKVIELEGDVRALELEMKRESLENQKKMRNDYFRESYFDNRETETEGQ